MNTDKQLFQLFSVRPSWLFELAQIKPPKRCQFRPFTVKSLERRLDGLIVPDDPREPLWIIEFQLYFDPAIYSRIVTEMCGVQESYQWRNVRGLIFFENKKHDPRTEPWTQVVSSFVLRDLLESFQKTNPAHPLNAVFHPLMEPREDILETTAVHDLRLIRNSPFGNRDKAAMEVVFLDWLQQRFRNRGKKELEQMLLGELTPIEETRCGKELIEIGEQRGLSQGLSQGLIQSIESVIDVRFGQVPKTLISKMRVLNVGQLRELHAFAVQCDSIADVRTWLRSHDGK